jgi:hypothetical protein
MLVPAGNWAWPWLSGCADVTPGRISHVLSSRLMWNHSHAVACTLGMVYVRGGR